MDIGQVLGSGSFINQSTIPGAPIGSATATYVPDSTDFANEYVELVLFTDTNALCRTAMDTAVLYLQPVPMVDGTPDSIICADLDTLVLDGIVTNASGATWSSSNPLGSFINIDLANGDASYVIHADDTTAHTVDLTLTSVLEGFCTQRTSVKNSYY